jgi:biotin transporter BioY
MPKKKTTKRSTVRKPQITSSQGPSYDTKMLITIILLLFVYPLGLIFMWAWMHTWPVWLKIIITLPFIISAFVVIMLLSIVGNAIKDTRMQRTMYRYQQAVPSTIIISPTITPGY